MAFLIKNTNNIRAAAVGTAGVDEAVLSQWIHVSAAARAVPASGGTDILFRVNGGRVLVHYLLGEVTTIMDSTDPALKYSSKALSAASVAIGTAVDVAATANLASKEVGALVSVLGSGAAFIISNAGAGLSTLGRIPWVAPQGEIYLTTGGTNLTGAMKHDIWYQPIDDGAYVVGTTVTTTAI